MHISEFATGVNGDGAKNVNVGVAGSITMILLCSAVAGLCISFYRRYKRAQGGDFDLGDQELRDARNPIPAERENPEKE